LLASVDDGNVVAPGILAGHAPRTLDRLDSFNRGVVFRWSGTVQPRSLEQRVTMLEQQMQVLRELPARVGAVELQIVQLRGEMKGDFMRVLHEEVLARIATIGEHLQGTPPPARRRTKR